MKTCETNTIQISLMHRRGTVNQKSFIITIYSKQSSKKHLYRRKSYNSAKLKSWASVNGIPKNPALFSSSKPDMSPRSKRKPARDFGELHTTDLDWNENYARYLFQCDDGKRQP